MFLAPNWYYFILQAQINSKFWILFKGLVPVELINLKSTSDYTWKRKPKSTQKHLCRWKMSSFDLKWGIQATINRLNANPISHITRLGSMVPPYFWEGGTMESWNPGSRLHKKGSMVLWFQGGNMEQWNPNV